MIRQTHPQWGPGQKPVPRPSVLVTAQSRWAKRTQRLVTSWRVQQAELRKAGSGQKAKATQRAATGNGRAPPSEQKHPGSLWGKGTVVAVTCGNPRPAFTWTFCERQSFPLLMSYNIGSVIFRQKGHWGISVSSLVDLKMWTLIKLEESRRVQKQTRAYKVNWFLTKRPR